MQGWIHKLARVATIAIEDSRKSSLASVKFILIEMLKIITKRYQFTLGMQIRYIITVYRLLFLNGMHKIL